MATAHPGNSSVRFVRFSDWRTGLLVAFLAAASLPVIVLAWRMLDKGTSFDAAPNAIGISKLAGLRDDSIVEVAGVVTFVDQRSRQVYLQDSSGALAITVPANAMLPVGGDELRVRARLSRSDDATAGPGPRDSALRDIAIVRTGRHAIPAPAPVQ
jgi:hypothetical protein